MVEEYIDEDTHKKGFFEWLRSVFHKEEIEEVEKEAPKYKRRLMDGRIEKYLDQNLNGYIQEYGILTGLDIESYDIRYNELTGRISEMKEYMAEADAQVAAIEKDILSIEKASKKK